MWVKGSDSTVETVEIPLVGTVPAGTPVDAVENIERNIALDKGLFPYQNLMALRVSGDSMVDAGINDGDIAVVERQCDTRSGDLVVVMLNGEVTLKRLLCKSGKPVLHPENRKYKDIVVGQGDTLEMVGKVRGIVRNS